MPSRTTPEFEYLVDAPQTSRLLVYIPGELPSFTETSTILVMVEVHVIWAAIALVQSRLNYLKGDRSSWSSDEPWYREFSAIENGVLNPITESYSAFLKRKYFPVVTEAVAVAAFGRMSPQMDVKYERNPYRDVPFEDWIRYGFLRDRQIGGDQTDFDDVVAWISSELGPSVFPTIELSTSRSVEFLTDIAQISAMVVFEHAPLAKEICLYAAGRIREIIRGEETPRKRDVAPIRLTPAVTRLIAKYDDVDVEFDQERQALKMSLRRNHREDVRSKKRKGN
jgi:hypothetical protein